MAEAANAMSQEMLARLLAQEQFSLPLGGVSDLRDAVNRSHAAAPNASVISNCRIASSIASLRTTEVLTIALQ